MSLTNCSNCQYYNSHPHHSTDICCSLQPAYATMYAKLKDLDAATLASLPLDNCSDFELNPQLVKENITLSLTFQEWQQLARDSSCSSTILNSLKDQKIDLSLSLTVSDWQAIANRSHNSSVLQTLAQHEIFPSQTTENWIEVYSSCINAIAYDRQTLILKIRFNSGSEYEYRDVSSDVFAGFQAADSKGLFFNQEIKDVYTYSIL